MRRSASNGAIVADAKTIFADRPYSTLMSMSAVPGVYDKDFFTEQLSRLYLDDRAYIVDMMWAKCKFPQYPNLANSAREYYGREVVDGLCWMKRFALYKIMAWIWNNRVRILHHKIMKDRNLTKNVFNFVLDEEGNGYEKYDDHADWWLLSGEERNLLIRESYAYYKRANGIKVMDIGRKARTK